MSDKELDQLQPHGNSERVSSETLAELKRTDPRKFITNKIVPPTGAESLIEDAAAQVSLPPSAVSPENLQPLPPEQQYPSVTEVTTLHLKEPDASRVEYKTYTTVALTIVNAAQENKSSIASRFIRALHEEGGVEEVISFMRACEEAYRWAREGKTVAPTAISLCQKKVLLSLIPDNAYRADKETGRKIGKSIKRRHFIKWGLASMGVIGMGGMAYKGYRVGENMEEKGKIDAETRGRQPTNQQNEKLAELADQQLTDVLSVLGSGASAAIFAIGALLVSVWENDARAELEIHKDELAKRFLENLEVPLENWRKAAQEFVPLRPGPGKSK